MGIFDRGRKKSEAPAQDLFPPQGSRLDTVPGMDDDSLWCIKYWLEDWFRALVAGDNPTISRLLITYGEALESNGLRATLNAVQQGIDGSAPRQRPWRWLSLGAAAANAAGEYEIAVKIFYFMLQFDTFVREAIEANDVDGFIEMGIDPPVPHSKYLVATQAVEALMRVSPESLRIPAGQLSIDKLRDAAIGIIEQAQEELETDGGVHRERFLVGRPMDDGVWTDSKSGEFRYGRRI